MGTLETHIADHYTTGGLFDRIKQALAEMGVDPQRATPQDLKLADEFHTGGIDATDALLDQLTITPQMQVLDIGCGIGGPARLLADRHGCHVIGVDLTPEFVTTAEALSEMVGLGDRVRFLEGSALRLPVDDASADLALLMHVGMNIDDKGRLLAEAFRALRPDGTLAVYEVMGGPVKEPLVFPLPWSERPETSFLATPDDYKAAAAAAGFALLSERNRTDFAREFFEEAFAKVAENGPMPLGIHLMMRETAGQKLRNYVDNLHAGRLAPFEMIFQKPSGSA